MAAGVGIIGMIADGHPAAEIYTAGVTRDQAQYLFDDAVRMVDASPALRTRIEMGVRNLAVMATGSYMRPVSSERRSLDQKRVHMALIDEIHEHRTGIVVEKMRAGTKGDPDALVFEITNSGYDRTSVCWQHHEYSVKVLEGAIENDSWFAYIAALDEGDDWTDEAVWPKANPLLGVTVTLRYLREQVQEALDMPAKQALVQRLNFCIWTEASVGAIPMEQWDAGSMPSRRSRMARRSTPASTSPPRPTSRPSSCCTRQTMASIDVLARFWAPQEGIAIRSRRDHVPYESWVARGLDHGHARQHHGLRRVREEIRELAERYEIREIAYDRWNATQLVTQLIGDGATCVPIGQGFASLTAPTKEWLADIAARPHPPRREPGAALDGRQPRRRAGRCRQHETVEGQEHRADRRPGGSHHGQGPDERRPQGPRGGLGLRDRAEHPGVRAVLSRFLPDDDGRTAGLTRLALMRPRYTVRGAPTSPARYGAARSHSMLGRPRALSSSLARRNGAQPTNAGAPREARLADRGEGCVDARTMCRDPSTPWSLACSCA